MSLSRRHSFTFAAFVFVFIVLFVSITFRPQWYSFVSRTKVAYEPQEDETWPQYLPEETWSPPPVRDPFAALTTASHPLPVPHWNKPVDWRRYDLDYAPPLLIGFTRTWPILLQAVVSYITAGWPPSQIYVVENTGTQRSNQDHRLTLQNPYFLNYTQLRQLGVNVISTPVLLNFAQLQNYYIHLSHEHGWPFYFWSHMDVLALSYETGEPDVTARVGEDGYKSMYTLCLEALAKAKRSQDKWAHKFFAYDHLTLVNRHAYEDVGGWDTFIPYYMTDCDMHSRLLMQGWDVEDIKAGIVADVSSVLDDLSALYRIGKVSFEDVNPAAPPPTPPSESTDTMNKRNERDSSPKWDEAYYNTLRETVDAMVGAKHSDRGRNTWQAAQRGGKGEPYYYHPRGIAEGIDMMTEAGRAVFREKWGHRDCDLIQGTNLAYEDQWKVKKDW